MDKLAGTVAAAEQKENVCERYHKILSENKRVTIVVNEYRYIGIPHLDTCAIALSALGQIDKMKCFDLIISLTLTAYY